MPNAQHRGPYDCPHCGHKLIAAAKRDQCSNCGMRFLKPGQSPFEVLALEMPANQEIETADNLKDITESASESAMEFMKRELRDIHQQILRQLNEDYLRSRKDAREIAARSLRREVLRGALPWIFRQNGWNWTGDKGWTW